jgi:hypothetical protein
MASLLAPVASFFRRRKREQALTLAASWPIVTAKLLKSIVLEKDALAEEATAFQDRQVESAFYFTLSDHPNGSYFGGHLRSVPLSDSEAHRALRLIPEDTVVQVRYNPANPDENHTFAADNPSFPVVIWPF